jgi:hypothetical protein
LDVIELILLVFPGLQMHQSWEGHGEVFSLVGTLFEDIARLLGEHCDIYVLDIISGRISTF